MSNYVADFHQDVLLVGDVDVQHSKRDIQKYIVKNTFFMGNRWFSHFESGASLSQVGTWHSGLVGGAYEMEATPTMELHSPWVSWFL